MDTHDGSPNSEAPDSQPLRDEIAEEMRIAIDNAAFVLWQEYGTVFAKGRAAAKWGFTWNDEFWRELDSNPSAYDDDAKLKKVLERSRGAAFELCYGVTDNRDLETLTIAMRGATFTFYSLHDESTVKKFRRALGELGAK